MVTIQIEVSIDQNLICAPKKGIMTEGHIAARDNHQKHETWFEACYQRQSFEWTERQKSIMSKGIF
jgi:hypothetical protein